jgi:nucleotide-binding universal stress UspA family protein
MTTDPRVIACVDLTEEAPSVADHAAWAAQGLGVGLELLHVIERHPGLTTPQDHSGAIGLNAQEQLLEQLANDDETRTRADRERGRLFLNQLRERALAAGAHHADTRQRHGDIEETLAEQATQASLMVMGRRSHLRADAAPLGQHVEWMVRAVRCPALVVPAQFIKPSRVLLAFDGSVASRQWLQSVANNPLLQGLPIHVLMAGATQAHAAAQVARACETLQSAGLQASHHTSEDAPAPAVERAVIEQGIDLVVMGAYSHGLWRHLLKRSNTQAVLSRLHVPALLLRA